MEDPRCTPCTRLSTWVIVVMALVAGTARSARAEPVTEYEAGRPVRVLDAAEAEQRGLTVLDLSDDFVPSVFRGDALHTAPAYAATYRALANERPAPATSRSSEDRYLELYGIFPSFGVLAARLADGPRYACHAAVDDAPLAAYTKQIAALAAPVEPLGPKARAGQTARSAALRVVQQRLACDGLLTLDDVTGLFDARTTEALRVYQQRHMIVSWGVVDAATRGALLTAPRTLDFRALLRALRERVVAASGLIEDGTARGVEEPVLGQLLDPPELRAMHAYAPLKQGAPDLVSRATDAAARALGVLGPDEAVRFLGERDHARAAVRLPPAPPYHSAHMELRAELDRGDVWYGFPYDAEGHKHAQPVAQRPTLVLYARDGEREVALLRWNTTIGGFQPELSPSGALGLRYKESEVGPRVWRRLYAAPAWLPPDTTPDAELVRRQGGRHVLHREALGPGYGSAYGLAMLVNELVWRAPRSGQVSYADHGVRVHGSVSYRSILRGYSHGCHRLFNHLGLRLASFLVAHRTHRVIGDDPVAYRRMVRVDGALLPLSVDTRGFLYELDPPIPVQVLPGNVRGARKRPIEGLLPLPLGYKL